MLLRGLEVERLLGSRVRRLRVLGVGRAVQGAFQGKVAGIAMLGSGGAF